MKPPLNGGSDPMRNLSLSSMKAVIIGTTCGLTFQNQLVNQPLPQSAKVSTWIILNLWVGELEKPHTSAMVNLPAHDYSIFVHLVWGIQMVPTAFFTTVSKEQAMI